MNEYTKKNFKINLIGTFFFLTFICLFVGGLLCLISLFFAFNHYEIFKNFTGNERWIYSLLLSCFEVFGILCITLSCLICCCFSILSDDYIKKFKRERSNNIEFVILDNKTPKIENENKNENKGIE